MRIRSTPAPASTSSWAPLNPAPPLRYNFVDHPSAPIVFYAHFHCKTLRDRAMRGLGYGSHIERSVVSSRITDLPPVS